MYKRIFLQSNGTDFVYWHSYDITNVLLTTDYPRTKKITTSGDLTHI